jgi:hypothetical protein
MVTVPITVPRSLIGTPMNEKSSSLAPQVEKSQFSNKGSFFICRITSGILVTTMRPIALSGRRSK